MNPIELLEQSRNSSAVAFHKFVLLHREFGTDLFCFYEGKDTHYYFPKINQIYKDNHHPIICGNKKSVIETFEKIIPKYNNLKTAFFIDRDFDEKIEDEKLYCTPCYSIENLYCTESVLSRILKNEFMLHEIDDEYIFIINLFRQNQNEFHSAVKLFNAWYATAKEKAKKSNTIVNISLNEKFPKDFAVIKIGNIQSNYTLNDIMDKYPDSIQVTEEELKDKLKNFEENCNSCSFRGKYEIEFFTLFLKYLIEDANIKNKFLKKKTKFSVDSAQILSQLSQYSETPECLIVYLTKIKKCA
ncbi:DUF4435 domain-containing protein [Flavobacterium sp. FPG59]|uniref:DUF4435 domain-containing protein n=1 Tax=Flavobacterium sp. FPG59 TaxID=1929267 RepID=UPI000A3BD50F|nr:DUF4435 domain-containing protein [Flavobacterium sp. FPG59]OUD31030.1 hypothetical protein FPG59_15210 [Flavobacterium sp. FPG59]